MLAAVDEFYVEYHVVSLPWQASLLIGAVLLLVLAAGAGILVWFLTRKQKRRKIP
ncbi:MAG TPA: hypothetical protein VHM90_20975 [Phycisphaerae bacterium]|jgi:hypothetical protein|nr:hypothetical protein [Phycisphaerae bacterium]